MAVPSSKTVGRRTLLLTLGTLVSRLLGMVRETLIAASFSVLETDAFFIAWRIPNALRALLAEGALSAALVPIFSSTLLRGDAAFAPAPPKAPPEGRPTDADSQSEIEQLRITNHLALRTVVARLRALSLAVLVPLSALGVLFAEPVMRFLVGDFGGDAARFGLAVHLLRQLFPYIFFMGSAAVGVGTLQSLGRFGALAFAPALLNVSFLVAPVAFVPLAVSLHRPAVDGLAWAALLGGALQLAALLPSLYRLDLLPRPVLDLRHPAVRKALALMGPQLFTVAIYQIDVVLSNRFLASLPGGATSWFSYAQRIADIPQGLFILAIANSFLPELSRAMKADDRQSAAEMVGAMLSLATFVAVPVAAILASYGEAVVPLIYGYGRFHSAGPGAIVAVVASLRWQAVNVALLAMVRQLTAAFAAAQNTRTPAVISALDLVAFIALAATLKAPLGHAGIAAAIAGSTLVQLALLAVALKREIAVPWRRVSETLVKSLVASAAAVLAARLLVGVVPWQRATLSARIVCLAGGALLGTVYLLAAWLLRIPELNALRARLLRNRRVAALAKRLGLTA
ncbi:MAG: murein biosynthesis integral membrane protein MurJ [Myxococcales bacterium]|nr:murein biosynthesis integral membrane protein MurJ [Myxococcales bacterium]